MKKKGIVAGFIGIAVIAAALTPDKKIESIELSIPNYQDEYDVNVEIPVNISILPEGVNTDSLEYVVDGDALTFSDSEITTGSEEGNYKVYISSGDIQSNILSINVVDISAREEAIVKAEAERLIEEKARQDAKEQEVLEEQVIGETEIQKVEERAVDESIEQQAKAEKNETQVQTDANVTAQSAEPQPPVSAPAQTTQETSPQNITTAPVSSDENSNFNTYDNAAQQQTEATYVLNTNTMKIHYSSCPSVKKIAPQNYSTSSSSIDELILQGYSTCGNCFK
ncbi:MAG: hypothetical protein K2N15_09540 [Lachnospiraceae bacterium]|nr:hypothetical protein [Lachnospiraceae bacterium]